MIIKCSETKTEQLYRILIGSVVPRPIAWVSTTSTNDVDNLAPFSFYNVFSIKPPMLGFSPGYKQPATANSTAIAKDTLTNVRETGEFVVNVVSQFLVEQMNQSSADYPPDVSEFAAIGLTATPSAMVKPPRVGEALISMECKVFHIHDLGGSALVLGEIVCIHLNDKVVKTNVEREGQLSVDLDILQPVGRLSGNLYSTINERFEIARPEV
ncbi:flavin reductase family protein [bacterium]|jgi:flavin reductase (DIM6/NTAB) family NADH-FMN oxidoreductase RutF|nr:flavin reductase family protein [bacterium]